MKSLVSKSMVMVLVSAAVVIAGTDSVPRAGAAGVVTPSADAVSLATAIASEPSLVVGAEFVVRPPGSPTALVTGGVAGFPTNGTNAALLSTGDAQAILLPNSSGASGTDLGGSIDRGETVYDVTVLRIDLQIPANVNCLAGIDFRYLSEEYPEFVSSSFNDAFVAELDRSTWTINGSDVVAPDNFAFDPTGNVITMNAAGVTSMTAEGAAGTTFDGATPILTAATPITPGAHSLYLSIFDLGDGIYDSAVVVDNLRLAQVANLAQDCRPGAVVKSNEFVPLVPARLLETRPGLQTVDGVAAGGGALGAGTVFELPVAGRGGVAADASAVVLNVTVAGAQGPGFVTVFPCGATRPTASNLNFVTGSTVANAVTSKVGTGGRVCVFTSGTTDLIVDANGYFPS